MSLSTDYLIQKLNLKPHPEGGFFSETYRSKLTIAANSLPTNYAGSRHASTCIYFLLTSEAFSAFHRITQDEIWHFYLGAPIRLHVIFENGVYREVRIGNNLENGEHPQFVVPGGSWFAAELSIPNSFGLVGCTVAPGFDFQDFELGVKSSLKKQFPEHQTIINRLTRN